MVDNLKDLENFAHYIADKARKISLRFYKKKIKIKSKLKKEFDPVTLADLEVQNKINFLINKKFPNHSILGEEKSILKNSIYEWCVDPIDGTKSFIQGVPLWGTLISLSKKNKIILGVADIPALDERYVGINGKAYKIIKSKKTYLHVRNTKTLKDTILNTTSPYLFRNKLDQLSFERLCKKVKSTRLGGDCYSYCLLADGHIDLVVESGLKPWDIRALEPIIVNAGGVIRTWNDKSVLKGGSIIASTNNKIFRESRKILSKKNPVSK
tara:strand:- start:8321 stop:9124 length:804 start_codon:yes stop_codon:yes gene_type:complete